MLKTLAWVTVFDRIGGQRLAARAIGGRSIG